MLTFKKELVVEDSVEGFQKKGGEWKITHLVSNDARHTIILGDQDDGDEK